MWRETTEPEWTHLVEVGDTTRHTLDLSKDSLFFGVRAGNRSPVAFPAPAR